MRKTSHLKRFLRSLNIRHFLQIGFVYFALEYFETFRCCRWRRARPPGNNRSGGADAVNRCVDSEQFRFSRLTPPHGGGAELLTRTFGTRGSLGIIMGWGSISKDELLSPSRLDERAFPSSSGREDRSNSPHLSNKPKPESC